MPRTLAASSLFLLGALALGAASPACGASDSSAAQGAAPSSPSGGASTATDGRDGPDGATAPTPTGSSTVAPPVVPPVPEWVAPQVATTSPACGTAQPQAIGATYTTPAGRTYHVWGPSSYDPTKTYPVVMSFHGWYADGAAHESWFKMEDYTENEAFVVYPDAVAGLWDLNGTTDLVFFDDMVKQLGETYCINPSQILGYGFSYGGKFMNHLGCKRAGFVKAIAIGDGSDGGDGQGCGRLPVLFTVRTADTDELPAWGKAASEAWATIDRCDAGTDPSEPTLNCISHRACKSPGNVTFCEDTFFDASWPKDWNHTVREPYRAFTWKWFKATL